MEAHKLKEPEEEDSVGKCGASTSREGKSRSESFLEF